MTNYLEKLQDKWEVLDETRLRRIVKFSDFKGSIDFVNKIADKAEELGHHPDLHIHYNEVIIVIWTHDVEALTEKDFELANAIETLIEE